MTPRPATSSGDPQAIQRLASRRWPQGWHPGGLGWWLSRWQVGQGGAGKVIVFDSPDSNDAIVAWATVGQHDEGEVSVQAASGHDRALDAALDWALDGRDALEVSIEVYDGDHGLVDALTARGFTADSERPVLGMVRAADTAEFSDLAGYVVRQVADHEFDERVEVHRRSWKPATLPWADGRVIDPDAESSFTKVGYDAVRGTWLYRQDLDLVAEAPDGSLAACCIAWLDPATGVAEIEPVGVDPEHRRRGLAVALCLEVARRVQSLGGRELFLNVAPSEAYPANAAAYAKAGFRVVPRGVLYARPPIS